jgi:hypothetical protein
VGASWEDVRQDVLFAIRAGDLIAVSVVIATETAIKSAASSRMSEMSVLNNSLGMFTLLMFILYRLHRSLTGQSRFELEHWARENGMEIVGLKSCGRPPYDIAEQFHHTMGVNSFRFLAHSGAGMGALDCVIGVAMVSSIA